MRAARECSGLSGEIEFVSCNTILFVDRGYSCNDIWFLGNRAAAVRFFVSRGVHGAESPLMQLCLNSQIAVPSAAPGESQGEKVAVQFVQPASGNTAISSHQNKHERLTG